MKTLYVSDLDGTLLNEHSVLSDYTIENLNKIIEKGVLFTAATARTPATVIKIFEKVNLNLPLIVMTGASHFNMATKEYNNIVSLSPEKCKEITDILHKHPLCTFAYTLNNHMQTVYYSNFPNPASEYYIRDRSDSAYKKFILCDDFNSCNPLFYCVIDKTELLYDLQNQLKDINDIAINFYPTEFDENYSYLEIFDKGASKAIAVKNLAKVIGADKIVAFGDGVNDMSLFEVADASYAMENATQKLRNIASQVIGSNVEDSVIKKIMELEGIFQEN